MNNGGIKQKILFVCTGNICRSVMAERIFLELVGGQDGFIVLSAGTEALSHYRIEGKLTSVMRSLGVDPGEHRPKQLTREIAEDSSAILVMEKKHKEFVKKICPSLSSKVFLIKEFGGDGKDLEDPIHQEDPDHGALAEEIRGYLREYLRIQQESGKP